MNLRENLDMLIKRMYIQRFFGFMNDMKNIFLCAKYAYHNVVNWMLIFVLLLMILKIRILIIRFFMSNIKILKIILFLIISLQILPYNAVFTDFT